MDPSIHSDVFARYERGVLEIEHRVDDVRNFTGYADDEIVIQQWDEILRMIATTNSRK